MPRTHDFDAPHFDLLEQAIISLWVEGKEFTAQRVADMVAPRRPNQPSPSNGTARDRLKAMVREGLIEERDNGERKRPYALNRTGAPVAGASLAGPVAAFLADDAVPARNKADVISALRFVLRDGRRRLLEMRGEQSQRQIIRAAESVPASGLQILPQQCAALAAADRASGASDAITPRSEANYLATLRGLLRYIAEHRLAPLIFSVVTGEGPWEEVKALHLSPRNEKGVFTSDARYLRSAWDSFRRAILEVAPGGRIEPNDLTAAHIEAVYNHLRAQGKLNASDRIRHLWHVLTKAGFGPLVGATEAPAPLPSSRVRLATGAAPDNWEELAQALHDGAFSPELVDQVRWFGTYVTLDERELRRRRKEFPARPTGRTQQEGTVRSHVSGLRTWIGFALDAEGLTPADATPARLFGAGAEDRADAIATWWAERHTRGEVAAAWTTGLKGVLIPASMFALGCYERLKHARGAEVALHANQDGIKTRIDLPAEEAADKTPEEAAFYAAYRGIQHLHGMVVNTAVESAEGNAGSRGGGPNAEIDVLDLMRTVPPQWWERVLGTLLAEVRAGMGRLDESHDFHCVVMDTVWTATLITTGCRGKELAHVRADIQAPHFAADRRIVLRKVDRKNKRLHTVFAKSPILPDDVLQYYLTVTRPYFMRKLDGGAEAHPFLFMNAQGKPLGCPEETSDGKGRVTKKFNSRMNSYRSRWAGTIARHAALAGAPVPPRAYGVLGFHTVRRVHGFMVYLEVGLEAAANYLGDHPNSVMDRYAGVSGEFIDVAALRDVALCKQLPASTTALPAPEAAGRDELDVLLRAWGAGLLTAEEFAARKQALQPPQALPLSAGVRKLPSRRAVGVR